MSTATVNADVVPLVKTTTCIRRKSDDKVVGFRHRFKLPEVEISITSPGADGDTEMDVIKAAASVTERYWPDPDDFRPVAKRLMQEESEAGRPLRYWRDQWMCWTGHRWEVVSEGEIKKIIWDRLDGAKYLKESGGKDPRPPVAKDWKPNRVKVGNVLEALATHVQVKDSVEVPAWVSLSSSVASEEDHRGSASEYIAFSNGLLRFDDRSLISHTREYFNQFALPYKYDRDGRAPELWLRSLDQWLPGDAEAIQLVQEWFGYIVSGRTDLQKSLYIQGSSRSGKSTLEQVLENLIGPENVLGGLSADNLTERFGLSGAIGKALLVFPDIHFGRNARAASETLKKLVGGDAITIDRKGIQHWTGRLPGRVMFMSNHAANFPDASGAAQKRLLFLEMNQRFEGAAQNPHLVAQLREEMPGILNWSLDGLERLSARGHFIQPQSAKDALDAAQSNGSPLGDFTDEFCVIGADEQVACDDLYRSWKAWCQDNGHTPGASNTFGQRLKARMDNRHRDVEFKKQRGYSASGRRPWFYRGLGLRPMTLKVAQGGV